MLSAAEELYSMQGKYVALKPFNSRIYYKNRIFNNNPSTGTRYLIEARQLLAKNNIVLNTIDIDPGVPTSKDIYIEAPYPWEIRRWSRLIKNKRKNILFIGEPPIINPFSFMRVALFFFSRVYTYDDNIIDNKKYFKFFQPKYIIKVKTKKTSFKDKTLLILMNSNLSAFLPFKLLSFSTKELYSERIKAINFFDKNFPLDFSLYGRGWNRPQKFSILQRFLGCRKYKTYKGEFPQKDKYEILSQFRFCLCFENSANIGYISEKIVECFKGRCVPIYWGAPNITDFISDKCFIDFRKFKDYSELVKFLKNIDEKTYNSYLKNIEELLLSKQFLEKWTSEAFAKTFLKVVKE